MPGFAEWESFYVIVGGAAAALIGLQFVVMTLIAESPHIATPEGGAAFASPTIVHFATVLLLAALLRVPWQTVVSVATVCALVGVGGLLYMIVVTRRMRSQKIYRPDFEDWLSHCALPLASYALLLLSALAAPSHDHAAMFGVAAAVLLLLFTAIHNAWDTIAYQVFVKLRTPKD